MTAVAVLTAGCGGGQGTEGRHADPTPRTAEGKYLESLADLTDESPRASAVDFPNTPTELVRLGEIVCHSFERGDSLSMVQNMSGPYGVTEPQMNTVAASATTHLCPEYAGRVTAAEIAKAEKVNAAQDAHDKRAAAARAKRYAQKRRAAMARARYQRRHTINDDGTVRIGPDLAPGTYVTNPSGYGCYWERTDRTGKTIESDFSRRARVEVTIRATDYSFTTRLCGSTWRAVR